MFLTISYNIYAILTVWLHTLMRKVFFLHYRISAFFLVTIHLLARLSLFKITVNFQEFFSNFLFFSSFNFKRKDFLNNKIIQPFQGMCISSTYSNGQFCKKKKQKAEIMFLNYPLRSQLLLSSCIVQFFAWINPSI